MNDSLYHYIDPQFNYTQVGNYTLLLQLSETNFSLAVTHGDKLMVWRHDAPLTELTQPGEVQEVLNFHYANVVTGIKSSAFTLVPQGLLDQETTIDTARLLDVKPEDTVFSQPLDDSNDVIFKATPAVTQAIQRFGNERVIFGASGWLQAIASSQPSGYHLYINIYHQQFDVAYFRQGKLQLFNTFDFTHEDELAYYTAFVCQQLKLDMSTVSVVLSGSIAHNDMRYHNILTDIFKTVELNNTSVVQQSGTLPAHQFLSLTALSLCASLADA
ncbi:DUF3822 family protein [uncultured Mucilaginibacter sp.]|uniref:DUF3822 family protein n=1 Tax=uncultured Mucilaginibacter sp. TaxID=797541 RepID=UPI0025EC4EDA|nr:DUF3822 family protein [uncultured Mucilaginibacter sp.]